MPPKKSKTKSVWRSDKAQHFQVVHRSQRDPLINDPAAGQHVLKAVAAPNAKGKTRAQLENEDANLLIGKDGKPLRGNVGEAALYGIYFDDTEYDYMQHLRPIRDNENSKRGGQDEQDDTETIMISAPTATKPSKSSDGGFALRHDDTDKISLPASAFPSEQERPFSFTNHLNVDPSLQGFQPDMDPHLRQALEALEDDAFVDGDLEDDFFAEVVQSGEWDGKDASDDEWRQLPPEGDEAIYLDPAERAQKQLDQLGDAQELSLEARVALFKKTKEMERLMAKSKPAPQAEAQVEVDSDEERDELASLPRHSRAGTALTSTTSVLGKKGRPGAQARRAASSKAGSVGGGSTAWSMSSSSMSRNKGLSDLDDHFAKLGRQYGIREDFDPTLDSLSDPEYDDQDDDDDDDDDDAQTEEVSRQDFENIMDEFLDKYEVIAGKLKERLGDKDATGEEKLDLIRKALGRARIEGREWEGRDKDVGKGRDEDLGDDDDDDESDDEPLPEMLPRSHMRDKWDVETVLTTKTNVENHPRTITARESVVGASTSVRPSKIVNANARAGGAGVLGSVASSTYIKPGAAAFLDDDEALPKIRIDPRTGFPMIVGYTKPRGKGAAGAKAVPMSEEQEEEEVVAGAGAGAGSDDQDYDSDATEGPVNETVARDRNESKDEKKARKAAVKAAKQERRELKSQMKKSFAKEKKNQGRAERGRKEAEGAPSSAMRLL